MDSQYLFIFSATSSAITLFISDRNCNKVAGMAVDNNDCTIICDSTPLNFRQGESVHASALHGSNRDRRPLLMTRQRVIRGVAGGTELAVAYHPIEELLGFISNEDPRLHVL